MMPLYVLGLAMVTFLGYICYAEGLKTVRALDAVIITALTEPLSAMVLAFLILGEAIPQSVLAGGALIIAANILVSREHRKKRIRRCKEKKPQECFGWTW
jgi:drug/metabolite transporter (DMT)-like permease